MPIVSAIFRQFSLGPRRKRSGVGVNSATSSKSSGSVKEKKRQHSRAASEPLPNNYHEKPETNGGSHLKTIQIVDATAIGSNFTSSPSPDTIASPTLQGLAQATAIANSTPELSAGEKALNAVEGMALAASAGQEKATVLANIMTTTLQVTGGMDVVKDHITTLIETTKPLMDALDAVQKLHPFIGVAVLAFKAVWTLEMKRRENNQKVLTLHVEMRDMIGVLVKLETVKDPNRVGPDGKTIENRLKHLVQETADTIQDCANACDTYTKKKIIVKVLSGPVWENKLANFAGHFTKLRSGFEFELTIHTSVGVDNANKKLDDMQVRNAMMQKKIDEMMEMMRKMSSPDEKRLEKVIERKGGREAVLENAAILREVSKKELSRGYTEANGKPYTFEDLQDDLKADINELLEKNMNKFSRKIQMQQEKLAEEVKDEVKRTGDRVIAMLESGPHERLLDPDIYRLWKDMQWRGSVKTRLFVMTMRDFFHERWGSKTQSGSPNGSSIPDTTDRKANEWALAYLDTQWLQPICQAVDDNASGFVTINEVNAFTSARPLDWSLLHWIAYWAIGWHQSINYYAEKIRGVFAKMFAILPNITDINLPHFHKYLDQVYQEVTTVEASINPCLVNEALQSKFSEYIESEEKRLRKKLATVRYDIDHVDMIPLLTGSERLGKHIHCLLYLLLERHFQIFRLAQKPENIINSDELFDAAGSILVSINAFKERYQLLLSVFRQQRLDPKQQFETYGQGMFRYMYDPRGLWSPKLVKAHVYPDFFYDDKLEDQTIYEKVDDMLLYGLVKEGLDYAAYDPYPPQFKPFGLVDSLLEPIIGTWNALQYRNSVPTVPSRGMMTMTLLPVQGEGNELRFKASARAPAGNFIVRGRCMPGEKDDKIRLRFKREFQRRVNTQYWFGEFDPCTGSISGTWGTDSDPNAHFGVFILKRTDPLDLRFRPAPIEFGENKAKASWKYARLAITSQIKRKAWKWSYFQDRRDVRARFFELYIRNSHFGKPLDTDEMMQWREIRRNLTSADVRFYQSYIDFKVGKTVLHHIPCKRCHGRIGKARNICLQCQDQDTSDTLDLCSPCQRETESKAETMENSSGLLPHLHTHEVAKVRRIIHIRDFGKLYQDASKALQFARAALNPANLFYLESGYDSDFPSQTDLDPSETPIHAARNTDPICTHCKGSISIPCWCYINPEAGTFICDGCEEKGLSEKHDLVRCHHLDPDFNQGLGLEERLASLEKRFTTLTDGLRGLESNLDTRFRDIEALLRAVLRLEQSNASEK